MAKRSRVIGYAIQHGNGSVTVKEFAKMRKSKRKGRKRATKKQLAALRKARAAMCRPYGYRKTRKARRGRKRRATPAQMRALRKAWAARRRGTKKRRSSGGRRRKGGLRGPGSYPHLSGKQYAALVRMQRARRRR